MKTDFNNRASDLQLVCCGGLKETFGINNSDTITEPSSISIKEAEKAFVHEGACDEDED